MDPRTRRGVLGCLAAIAGGIAGCSETTEFANEPPSTPTAAGSTPGPTPTTSEAAPVRWEYDFDHPDARGETERCTNCSGLRPLTVTEETVYAGYDWLAALDPADGSERWRFEPGPPIASRPVVRQGTVFVLTGYDRGFYFEDKQLQAVDAGTGERRWQTTPEGSPMYNLVGASADSVFVAEFDDVHDDDEYTYVYDATDGSLRRRHETGDVVSPGRVIEGTLYLTSPVGLFAFDASSGEKRWSIAGSHHSSYDFVGGTIYTRLDGDLVALDPVDGRIQWQFSPARADVGYRRVVTPEMVFLGTYDGHLVALDSDTGEERWRAGDDEVDELAVNSEAVYVVTADGDVVAFDSETGDELWREGAGESLSLGRATEQGVYVGVGGSLTVYDSETGEQKWSYGNSWTNEGVDGYWIGDMLYASHEDSGDLVAHDRADGEEVWKLPLEGNVDRFVLAEEVLYVGTSEGRLYAIDRN